MLAETSRTDRNRSTSPIVFAFLRLASESTLYSTGETTAFSKQREKQSTESVESNHKTIMSDYHTVSSLEIVKRWVVEEEIDLDDSSSCQTGAATVVASNKRIATVSHY